MSDDGRYKSEIARTGLRYAGYGCLLVSVPITALALLIGLAAYDNLVSGYPDCETAIVVVLFLPLIPIFLVAIGMHLSHWRRRRNIFIIVGSCVLVIAMISVFALVSYADANNPRLEEMCSF